jgi:protein SCO1/2
MKNLALIISFLVLATINNYGAQNELNAFNDSIQVGIIEKIGDTIPLNLSFHNEQDSLVTLKSLVNKPTVFTFVYFDCPGLCSPLLDGVSQVIDQTDLVLGRDYQVITISFNFRDTPEKARIKKQNFLKKHSNSKEHQHDWIYLTGDSANIYKMVNAVGFKFKTAGNDFIHAVAIMVVSPKGKITRYLYGTSFLPIDFKMAILESQKGLARPGISHLIQFCYAYDPAGKRYVLDVLKITGTLILFFVIVILLFLLIRTKKKSKAIE